MQPEVIHRSTEEGGTEMTCRIHRRAGNGSAYQNVERHRESDKQSTPLGRASIEMTAADCTGCTDEHCDSEIVSRCDAGQSQRPTGQMSCSEGIHADENEREGALKLLNKSFCVCTFSEFMRM